MAGGGKLEAALRYAGRGWAVFPCYEMAGGACACRNHACSSPGKHPRTPRGFHEASTEEETVRAWWTTWPEANIGLPTGPGSGLWVLDIDTHHGGAVSLDEMLDEHGALPETPEVATGGGGQHFYFAHPGEGYGTRAGLRPGIDVRSDGGYVVAPPSNHASGGEYSWDAVIDDGKALADPPEWLLEIASTRRAKASASHAPGAIPPGERNATLLSLAGSMRKRGLDADEIAGALHRVNVNRCSPPLDESEVEQVAMSVARYSAAEALNDPDFQGGWDDEHNAARYERHVAGRLRVWTPRMEWMAWDGKRWKIDNGLARLRAVTSLARRLMYKAAAIEENDARGKALAAASGLLNAPRRDRLMRFALQREGLHCPTEAFDRDPMLLNVANGVLNLDDGHLRPHDPELGITRVTRGAYEPEAASPVFDAMLARILPSAEVREYVIQALGYSLTGSCREQCFFLATGNGANGKSTLLEAVKHALGDYAMQCESRTFLRRRNDGPRDDIAQLPGVRFALGGELGEGDRIDEPLMKSLVGGESVRARALYGKLFEFKPQASVWVGTNHLPTIKGSDEGIWRRVRVVPFEVVIPPEEQDRTMPEKLKAEADGILARLVAGALAWKEVGALVAPPAVAAAMAEYRSDEDVVTSVLSETTVSTPAGQTLVKDLHKKLAVWCEDNGGKPPSLKGLTKILRAKGYDVAHGKKGNVVHGLGLLSEELAH